MEKENLITVYSWFIHARVEGHLDKWVQDYFGESTVFIQEDEDMNLFLELPDIAAVYGFTLRLRDLGVNLVSLTVERKMGSSGKAQ